MFYVVLLLRVFRVACLDAVYVLGGARPVISVVVCTRNRADSLSRTLEALVSLDVAGLPPVELVVVDNASTDHTASVLDAVAVDPPFHVTRIFEVRTGLSFARNAGIAAAGGDLIVFTDDDCLVPADWLRQAWTLFDGNFRQLVAGQVLLHDPAHLPVSIRPEGTPERFDRPGRAFGFLLGANMAFGRCVVTEIGAFDTRFGAGTAIRASEDIEFAYRAYIYGIPVRYEPAFSLRHDHGRTRPEELAGLTWGYAIGTGAMVAKHVRTGRTDLLKPLYWDVRSAVRNSIAHPKSWRHLVARFGYVVGALRYLLSQRKERN